MKTELEGSIASDEVLILRHELWAMLVCTVRYALGRRSYVVEEACDMVRKYATHLSEAQRLQIINEISHDVRMVEVVDKTLGDPCDHESWKRLIDDLSVGVSSSA